MLEGHGDDAYRYFAIKADFSSNVLYGELNKELAAVISLESRMMRPTDFSPLK